MANDLKDSITKIDPDLAFRMFGLTESAKAIAAIEGVERLFSVRETISDSAERRENGSIFEKLRLILTYTASTSRIFWPPGKKAKARGDRLRKLVGIPDDHALSDRSLRDNIEHFDERLDDWLGQAPRSFTSFECAVHEDLHATTVEALEISVPVLFFEQNLEICLFGRSYKLADLKRSLEDVRDKISESISAHMESLQSAVAPESPSP